MGETSPANRPRIGEIYWLDDCPPLDGHAAKLRPVVVIGSIYQAKTDSMVLVVAVSHTASTPARDPDMIRLPDLQQGPQIKTGLHKPSWAIPRWFVLVEPHRLRNRIGYLGGASLKRLIAAVNKRVDEAEPKS